MNAIYFKWISYLSNSNFFHWFSTLFSDSKWSSMESNLIFFLVFTWLDFCLMWFYDCSHANPTNENKFVDFNLKYFLFVLFPCVKFCELVYFTRKHIAIWIFHSFQLFPEAFLYFCSAKTRLPLPDVNASHFSFNFSWDSSDRSATRREKLFFCDCSDRFWSRHTIEGVVALWMTLSATNALAKQFLHPQSTWN